MADLFAGMNMKASVPAAAPSSDDNNKASESDGNDSAFTFIRTAEPNPQAPDVQEGAEDASSSFSLVSEMNGPEVEKKEAARSDDGSMSQLEEALASASLAEKKAGISLGVKGASASRVIKKRRAKRVGYAREGSMMTSPTISSQSTPEKSTRKSGTTMESTPELNNKLAREASLGGKSSVPLENPLELPPPSEMQSEPLATANGTAKENGEGERYGDGDGEDALTRPLDSASSVLDAKPMESATVGKTDGEEDGGDESSDMTLNAASTPSSDPVILTTDSTPSSTSAASAAAATKSSGKPEVQLGGENEMKRKGGNFLSFLSDKILKKTSKAKVPSTETDRDVQEADQAADPDLLGMTEGGTDHPTVPMSAPRPLSVSAVSNSGDLPGNDAKVLTLDLEGVDSKSDAKNEGAADAEKSYAKVEDPVQRASGEVSRTVFSFELFIREQLTQLDTINASLLNAQNALAQLSTEQESVDTSLAEKEAAQSQLAEGEDYEAAEALNPVIEDLATKKQKIVEELRSNTQSCDTFEKDRKLLKTKLKGSLSELSSELRKIEDREEKRVKHADADTIKTLDAKSRQLNSEEERIKLAEASNSRKERDLDTEEEAVSAQITHLTSDLVADLDTLTQEKFAVDAEVEELRRQLDEKLKLKSELCARQAELEEGILDVKKKFERQIQRLEEERRGLLAYKQECEDERSLLEEEKLDAARQKTLMLSVQQRFEALKQTVAADVVAAQTLEDALGQRDEKKIGLRVSVTDEQKIHSLRLSAAEAEEAFHEANTAFEAATEQLSQLREETKRLRQKLPQIEALKKAAAKARNFKEAGAHAQEYKQSEQRLEDIEQEQKEVQNKIAEAEPEIAKAQAALNGARQALKEGEQVAEVGNYNRLHEVIRDLKAAKRKAIKWNVGREGQELLSREVANAISLLFESEIAEVQAEAEVLRNRYDFEDFPIEEDEAEDDEDDEKDAQVEDVTEQSPAGQADISAAVDDEIQTDEDTAALAERNAKFQAELHELRRLHAELTALNTRIDTAVEDEDFDLAAELEPGRQEKEDELESFLKSHTITLEDLEKAEEADSAVAQTGEGDEQDEEQEEQDEDDPKLEGVEDTTTLENLEKPDQVESAVAEKGEDDEEDEEEEEQEQDEEEGQEQDVEVNTLEGAENGEEIDAEESREEQNCNSGMEDAEDTEGADTQAN